MNLFTYKKYAWMLLLPMVALLICCIIDFWTWNKSSDADISEQIFKTLPPLAASGRKIAVISTADSVSYKILRGYAGISPEVDIILDPNTLPDLARKLKKIAKAKPVSRLTFFGIGEINKSEGLVGLFEKIANLFHKNAIENTVKLRFTRVQPEVSRDDFLALPDSVHDLSSAFIGGAQVVFFNCWAGSDTSLLRAAGSAFLGQKGGVVIANPKPTKYDISHGGMFWSRETAIITWMDRPSDTRWISLKIQARSK